MEESNKEPTSASETATVITISGVGESLATVSPPPLPATDFTKVDNNLTGIGFFSASNKRSRKFVEKTTVVMDQGIEHRISILPSAKYGLPITQDQDYWLALMKLAVDHIQQQGKLTNPFTFTTAQLTKMLGQAHSGKNYKAVEEWLSVMAFTGVEGGAYNAVRKTWYTEKTHALDRVVTVGKKLPDGTVAAKNYVWFSQWQLDNINSGNLIAIELNTYTQLQTNIARNLVPYLQEWLFVSQHQGRFEKHYEDVCQLLGIRAYRYRSEIDRNFGPSLDELVTHGYISKWAIEPMATRKGYKLVLWHGRKYHSDRQARLDRNPQRKLEAAQPTDHTTTNHERRPRQKSLPLQPEVNADHLAGLTSRGVSDTAAVRKLVSELPADYPVLDVLEWADFQIAQQQGKITNAPGFYISLLRDQTAPPATFIPSRVRKQQDEANLRKRQAAEEAARLRQEQEQAADRHADARLDELQKNDPERYRLLQERARADLIRLYPSMAELLGQREGSAIHEGAIRASMKRLLLASHGQTTGEPKEQGSKPQAQTHSFIETPHQTTTNPCHHKPPYQLV